jgi:hypothetical protein
MKAKSKDDEIRTTIAILVYAVIAGSAFLFTKQASATIPAATLTAFRLCLGSIGLLTSFTFIFGLRGLITTFRFELFGSVESTKRVCLVGIMNTVIPYTLYAVASEHGIDVSVQAVMSGLSPIFAALLSHYYIPDAEPLWRVLKVMGLLLCICGGLLVTLHSEIVDGGMSSSSAVGVVSQLVAVLCKSAAAVLAEHTFKYHVVNGSLTGSSYGGSGGLTTNLNVMHYDEDNGELESEEGGHKINSPSFALGQACVGATVAIPLAILWDFILIPSRGQALLDSGFDWIGVIAPIFYLGLVSSCFVYYLQFYVVKNSGGLRQIITVDSLTPVVGVIEGALLDCDFCDVSQLSMVLSVIGASLCVCGVSLFQFDAYQIAETTPRQVPATLTPSVVKANDDYHSFFREPRD